MKSAEPRPNPGLKQKLRRYFPALALPLLVAAWPVISIFVENQNQLRFTQVIQPLILNFGLAAIVFVAARWLVRSMYKASLITSLIMAMLLLFVPLRGEIGQFLVSIGLKSPSLRSFTSIKIYCFLVLLLLIRQMRRSKNDLLWQQTVRLPALIMAALLVYSGFTAVNYRLLNRSMSNQPLNSPLASAKATTAPTTKPDIYYIILDRYASQQTLQNQYGFDNADFLTYLGGKGFTIPDSHANYPFTIQSLASSLNGQYLPTLSARDQLTATSTHHLQDMIIHSGALGFVKEQGYKSVQIGSWWDPTRANANADLSLQSPRGIVVFGHNFAASDFEAILLRQSVLQTFLGNNIKLGGFTLLGTDTIPSDKLHKQSGLYALNQLETLGRQRANQPKMVFAHILLPHPPYVLDANGNDAKVGSNFTEKQLYLAQMQYTNTRIKGVVDKLTSDPDRQPVIVIQADEGPYPARFDGHTRTFDWNNATDEELQQKMGILNAYYLPGAGTNADIYAAISPVNTFRTIFNSYFDTKLPLLPDNHFIDNSWQPYKLINLNDKLQTASDK